MGDRVAPSISILRRLSYSWSIQGEAKAQFYYFVTITK
jgi:hypothetical protein